MSYATFLLLVAARSGQFIAADMTVPDFREYHQDLIAGKIDMANAEAKVQYGMLHLRQALHNMRTPRFEEAIAVVRG
jgi:hypothetical protein